MKIVAAHLNPYRFAVLALIALAIWATASTTPLTAQEWREQFVKPPASARPHTWWHWMNGNVTRDGITRDLEAAAEAGIGGVQAFTVSSDIPPGPVKYMTPEWRDLMVHAEREANRLGLDFCFHNCAGWSSSGGPWITPDHAMYEVVWTEQSASGAGGVQLKQPTTRLDYFRDICVLAFPTPAAERDGKVGFRLELAKFKAGFERLDTPKRDGRTAPADAVIPRDSIVDLTSKLKEDGRVDWTPPEGQWTILRFGYTPTGRVNGPAPEEGRGLETDKMDVAATDIHWNAILQKVLDDAGNLAPKTLNNVLIDSYEARWQNWTHKFPEEFQKARGYDLRTYLPTVTGRVVDNVDVTERFLWDFRRTIADLHYENYFKRFATLCHERGLKLSIEPYGGKHGNFHDLDIAELADDPMGEFWAGQPEGWWDVTIKLAASTAHARGRTIVGAESFTSAPTLSKWLNTPGSLKAMGDHYYTQGLTRVIFHTMVHQPWPTNVLPGMTMGQWGGQFNRNNTWFRDSQAWLLYLTRCQYLLQQGTFVADLCYLASEDSPNKMLRRNELQPSPPIGYDYDAIEVNQLMTMTVAKGELILPSGMRYRVLVLPNDNGLRPNVLRKVRELAEAGAIIVGQRPTASPSLENYPKCDEEVQSLTKALWDGGRVIDSSQPLAETLKKKSILPDFEAPGQKPRALETIHRRIGDVDVYFVSNQYNGPLAAECIFRASGARAEIWDAVTGEHKPAALWRATDDHRTEIGLQFEQGGSAFVVFSPGEPAGPHATAVASPGGQFHFGAPATGPAITVVSAVYRGRDGDGGNPIDAADVLRARIRDGALKIKVSNELAGDPAPGGPKELRVEYEIEGVAHKETIRDGEFLDLEPVKQFAQAPPMAELAVADGKLVLRSYTEGAFDVTVTEGKKAHVEVKGLPKAQQVAGPWTVNLTPPQGLDLPAIPTVTLDALSSLSEQKDDAVRYFAGTAEYKTTFDVAADQRGADRKFTIDLGRVEIIAQPTLNGVPLGSLWKSPFRADVTKALRAGKNELTVRVTTRWPNRVIGDLRLAGDKTGEGRPRGAKIVALPIPEWVPAGKPPRVGMTFSIWPHWKASDELVPAGLIGPVTLYAGQETPVVP